MNDAKDEPIPFIDLKKYLYEIVKINYFDNDQKDVKLERLFTV